MFKIWSNIKRWFSGGFKKNPASHIGKTQFHDGEQHPKYDHTVHLAVYTIDVWAYASIRAIARAISQLPLLAQQQQKIDGKMQWETLEKGELYELVNKPNPDEPMNHLVERWISSALAAGDGYLLYDSDDHELYYVKPDLVKVKTDKMGRFVKYQISDGVRTISQEPEQLIHIKLTNPDGDYYGFPPSQVVKQTILTKLAMSKYINSYFKNNALAGTTFSTEHTLIEEQRAEIRQEFDRMHKGADNAFKMAILDGGVKLDRLSHNLKDLIPDQIYKLIREEVLAAYGVPHVMVGVLDDASYANADIQKRLFYENSVLPLLTMIESFINLQLTPQFGNDLRLWFDRSLIQALQEQPNEKAERLNKLINGRNQILTVNEARIELGYEAIVGFDELSTPPDPSQFMFGLGDEEEPEEDADDGSADENEEEKRYRVMIKRWRAHHSKVLKAEKEFAGIMVKFFDEQENRILARLTDLNFNGKLMSSVLHHELEMMERKDLLDDTNVLFNRKRENRLLKKAVEPKIKREIVIAGQQGINQTARKNLIPIRRKNDQFRVTEPEVQTMLRMFLNRMDDVNDTTYEAIKSIISVAYDEGQGADTVASAIKKEYDMINRVRSKRIAKTEMNGIVNGGNLLGAVQGGSTHKEWVCAYLPDTRQAHSDAGGQPPVTIDKPFIVGNDAMMHPGDPNASVGNVVNCYCSMVWFIA